MSTGRGNYLLVGIILFLGVGKSQLAGTNLGSGTAGEHAGPRSGSVRPGESPRIPSSLAGSTCLLSECVRAEPAQQLCSH